MLLQTVTPAVTTEKGDRRLLLLFLRILPHLLDTHAASPSIIQTFSAAIQQAPHSACKRRQAFFWGGGKAEYDLPLS